MNHTNTRRYAVKSSTKFYARILGSHCTLGEAYKTLVKVHKAHYRHHRFAMAQQVIAIIATEAKSDVIQRDIALWANQDSGPPSKKRLPLPIVVHQWDPEADLYTRIEEIK